MQHDYLKFREKKVPYTYNYGFLFPLLDNVLEIQGYFKEQNFQQSNKKLRIINTYLYDLELENLELRKDNLFLLHYINRDDKYQEWENIVQNLPNFVMDYTVTDEILGIKVFKFPEQFKLDKEKFLKGNYSGFSDEAIKRIINYYQTFTNVDFKFPVHTIQRNKDLETYWQDTIGISDSLNEYWGKPEIDNEILTCTLKEKMSL